MLFKYLFRSLLLALIVVAFPAAALEIGDLHFDDSLKLGNATVVANGGGVRSRAFFKVYAIVLYLPEKKGSAEAVLAASGPKRLAIVTMRDLPATQFTDALKSGVEKNTSEGELLSLRGDMQQFLSSLTPLGEVKKGTPVHIDWLPESGVHVTVAGKPVGKPINNEPLYRALLRIWLGDQPAQDDLKPALLGKAPR